MIAALWTGEVVEFHGEQLRMEPVRFLPTPVNGRSIPVWVGGVLPSTAGMRRATRWEGAVPIRFRDRALDRPSAEDIAAVRELVLRERGSLDGFDLVVWAEVADDPEAVATELPAYEAAGATWWIETARPPREDWYDHLRTRISRGPVGEAN